MIAPQAKGARVKVIRIFVSFAFAITLIPLGYASGWAASYYLGDHGDVGSAFLVLLTVPLGVVTGVVVSVVLAAKLAGTR